MNGAVNRYEEPHSQLCHEGLCQETDVLVMTRVRLGENFVHLSFAGSPCCQHVAFSMRKATAARGFGAPEALEVARMSQQIQQAVTSLFTASTSVESRDSPVYLAHKNDIENVL